MANTATNVSTGKPNIAGAVYVGAIGSVTVPTDASTTLGTGFTCLGFVSEDGLANENDLNFADIKEWGGATVYRSLTEMNDNFKLALLESENADVLKAVYGDSCVTVNSSGDISVDVKAIDPTEKVFVFELALRGNRKKRIVIPTGSVTERETITYKADEAIQYGITITAFPDANGTTHKEYIEGAPASV